ncbi:hypothetical protein ACTPEM_23970, partial [Clostridioides difficile]
SKVDITDEIIEEYKHKNEEFSNRALRVLAFAIKDVPEEDFIPLNLLVRFCSNFFIYVISCKL